MTDESAHQQQRHTEHQTVLVALLVHLEPVGQSQTGAAECGIARGDGAGDDAQHSQDHADAAHGLGADIVDGGGLTVGQRSLQTGAQTVGDFVDGAAGSGPDQSDDALTDHGAVEYHVALTLRLHAAGHQGRLGRVETRDRAAGHRDEHKAPDGLAGGLHVVEVGPQLRNYIVGIDKDADADAHSHDDQADAKDGVDFADDLIDGQEGGDEVVSQDDPQPDLGVGQYAADAAVLEQGDNQAGGADGKDGADPEK